MTENDLRKLAEHMRAELPELIPDAKERATVDESLVQALALPAGTASDALRRALRSHSAVRGRLEADVSRFAGQLGDATEPIGTMYYCPNRDYSVVRETPVDASQLCPTCGAVLKRFEG